MRDSLKVYKIKLHVLTPVFIGSGREIEKKEYYFSQSENKILVYDPSKFFMAVKRLNLSNQYESFLLKSYNSDLNFWMRDNRVRVADVSSAVCYSVDVGECQLQKRRVAIKEFIKDPYGKPYIPGSSLKGMLRTILLGNEIAIDRNRYESAAQSIKTQIGKKQLSDTQNENDSEPLADEIESIAFRTLQRIGTEKNDAVNDVFQGFVVSDSKPLGERNLVLCQKFDYHLDKQKKPLNVVRECLCPGSVVEFTLTIDSSVCKFDEGKILDAISNFNDVYYDEFLSEFGSRKRSPDTVYLGGGVGFVSKTVIYDMFKGDEGVRVTSDILRKKLGRDFIKHKHNEDVKLHVSPHILKCTRCNEAYRQMGICRFEIKSI